MQDLRETVESVGASTILPLLESNPAIKTFRHALALDERLSKFEIVHYTQADDAAREDTTRSRGARKGNTYTSAHEVWFVGGHAGTPSFVSLGFRTVY